MAKHIHVSGRDCARKIQNGEVSRFLIRQFYSPQPFLSTRNIDYMNVTSPLQWLDVFVPTILKIIHHHLDTVSCPSHGSSLGKQNRGNWALTCVQDHWNTEGHQDRQSPCGLRTKRPITISNYQSDLRSDLENLEIYVVSSYYRVVLHMLTLRLVPTCQRNQISERLVKKRHNP